MTEKEIIDGNRLIAEFMGGVCSNYGDGSKGWIIPSLTINGVDGDERKLKFHSDWNWLMLAWKKIAHDVYEYRHELSKEDYMTGHIFTKNMLSAFQKTDIESAWGNLVEFIKWYNQNTKS
jgi:hypothetical protein